jgi:hypothetical protein
MMTAAAPATTPHSLRRECSRVPASVVAALRNVLALRKLTADSKTQTSRAQGEILQNLSPALLTRVARVLAEMESAGGTDVRR